ncbi:MAG: AMP-binding protein [Desulfobacterota bacterium]|nr:AMP-binding protein [Thermodesulfobacteriota bacterium]MDW8002544.1 AMP-binding protein [Deltaproteobacteria bacterium]
MKSSNLPYLALTLNSLLELRAKENGERVALVKGDFFTYGRLKNLSDKVGLYLKRLNVQKGERVGILGENGPMWLISFFGIQSVGAICVPLDTRLGFFEIKGIIDHSDIRVLFTERRFIRQIADMVAERMVEIVDLDRDQFLDLIDKKEKNTYNLSLEEKPDPEDPAILFYTSGTTGTQKGILLSHRNVLSNIRSILSMVKVGEDDRFFSILPISHAYELVAGNLLPLAAGASIAYASSLKPKELLEDLSRAKPTIILAVPLFLEKLLRGIERRIELSSPVKRLFITLALRTPGLKKLVQVGIKKSMGLRRLRFFVSGGAHLPEDVEIKMRRLGFKVIQGYGLTEASPVVSLNPPDKPKVGSCGIPLPGVEVRIWAPGHDGVGEIVIRGENVMKGYYRNDEANKEVFLMENYLRTGDLGFLDKDGYLFIVGRKKSAIVTKGGLTIYPEEIENILCKSPYVKEALVLLKKRDQKEELHAIIFPDEEVVKDRLGDFSEKEEREKVLKEVIRREIETVSKGLADYKRIRSFSLRFEEFPKTTTNKIKRYLFEGHDPLR